MIKKYYYFGTLLFHRHFLRKASVSKHLKMSAMRRPQKKITTEIQGFVSQPVAMSSFISKSRMQGSPLGNDMQNQHFM